MVVGCSDFNAMKKIDNLLKNNSTYNKVKCPYCEKIHIDKLPRDTMKDLEENEKKTVKKEVKKK